MPIASVDSGMKIHPYIRHRVAIGDWLLLPVLSRRGERRARNGSAQRASSSPRVF
jgi:hypothetical protein